MEQTQTTEQPKKRPGRPRKIAATPVEQVAEPERISNPLNQINLRKMQMVPITKDNAAALGIAKPEPQAAVQVKDVAPVNVEVNLIEALTKGIKEQTPRTLQEPTPSIVGSFVVIRPANITYGQRYNLQKVRTYGKSDDNVVSLVWDNGLSTTLTYANAADADRIIELLDSYCL